MAELNDLKSFDIQNSDVNLWIFKKSITGKPPTLVLTGHWINLSDNLIQELKNLASQQLDQITETLDYALLAENNESSALKIPLDETHADQIITKAADQVTSKKADKIKKINNSGLYAVKLTFNNKNLYCVKKTDDSWKTKKQARSINTIFKDDSLDLDQTPAFNIAKSFDFFILEDTIFIRNKKSFESLLNYKQAHSDEFNKLSQEPVFLELFTDIAEITTYVGTNSIQLRRASAIHQKRHYADKNFMNNLRQECENFGLKILFDQNNKIRPTQETCPDIFKALLDHRLKSHFSGNIYDVQNTESINQP